MAPDVRSSTGGPGFDFNSQAGVLAVLGAIRISDLSQSDRNELRDLVFLYSNGGGDAGVRTVLEERLREANISLSNAPVKKITATAAAQSTVRASGFATGRPKPIFTAGKIVAATPAPVVAVPPPAPVVVTAAPVAPVVPQPRPVVVVPRPVTAIPPAPVPTPTSVAPIARVMPTIPTEVPAPVVPLTPVATPEPVTEIPNPAASARLERIRHIKSDVNGRVGNPVNLVDLDNALGREYMSALLEAMKLIADAAEADADRAMNRLEAVYARVLALLDLPKGETSTPVIPARVVAPISAPVAQVTETAPWGESDTIPVRPAPTPVPVRVMPTVPPLSGSPAQSAMPVQPVSAPVAPNQFQSVGVSQAPLRTMNELQTADEVNSKTAGGDPLLTKEVDAGLQQLLSEWSLFKKSGLFGTGPSGREHPLFVKLAPLPLPLLLAGRFEGSTQEIKQSVTDYMNGWRYEQGIVYEKDETFEHYLRRVIRHIIDLQITKRGA